MGTGKDEWKGRHHSPQPSKGDVEIPPGAIGRAVVLKMVFIGIGPEVETWPH